MDQIVMNPPGRTESVAPVCEIDPLKDSRWADFIERHPRACAFHSIGWLKALKVSYGYDPFVLTTAQPAEALKDGMVLCKIKSWLTGSRIVSLPFSDHCDPLVDDAKTLARLTNRALQYQDGREWKYIEFRPLPNGSTECLSESGAVQSVTYTLHVLDLGPSADEIFNGFHKSCIRRVINRANREKLSVKEGRSEELLRMFYSLLLLTRRRHELPPQPISWFRNVLECMGPNALIRVAMKGEIPVASILTLSHNRVVIYKYGCSDAAYHNLGGMSFLFWRAIQDAKESGAQEFDLGRSDLDNPGLIAFKGHLGAQASQLVYYRYPPSATLAREGRLEIKVARRMVSLLPNRLVSIAGAILYRHIG
jgi:hypothetical protein